MEKTATAAVEANAVEEAAAAAEAGRRGRRPPAGAAVGKILLVIKVVGAYF